MKIPLLIFGLACAASLPGQHKKFSWQDECFNHPTAPYCMGHEDAIKHQPAAKTTAPPADAASPNVVTNPSNQTVANQAVANRAVANRAVANRAVTNRAVASPSGAGAAAPALIEVGGIDWRFADPFADALVGFNLSELSASPLARSLISQLGAKQGLTEADMQKIFNGLSGMDQVAISVRENRVVVMVTGRVAEAVPPAPEAGWKAVSISGSAMLLGHADAVDQAVRRIGGRDVSSELTQLAKERQASSEFWAIGSARLMGPEAMNAGVKRFLLSVSVRNRLTSDMALEFYAAPTASTMQNWQTVLGATTPEGNSIHARTSMEADEVQHKFGQMVDGRVGESLAGLVASARYLPMQDTTKPKQTKPVIYGLDDGPRVVK